MYSMYTSIPTELYVDTLPYTGCVFWFARRNIQRDRQKIGEHAHNIVEEATRHNKKVNRV